MKDRIAVVLLIVSSFWACGGDSLTTSELPDPETGLKEVGRMTQARGAHVATLLQNGKVLIAGGYKELRANIADQLNRHISAEIFDPVTGSSSPTGDMTVGRYNDNGILLPDGRVLILPRLGRFPIEYYDPNSGRFNSVATVPTNPSIETAVLLPSGQVFATNPAHTGVFDPPTGTFPSIIPMDYSRYGNTTTLLNDGRVLIAGGTRGRPESGLAARNLIYDPSSRTFSAAGDLLFDRSGHKAVLLRDDRVLVVGGSTSDGLTWVQYAEIYEPDANTFSAAGVSAIQPTAALLLPSGRVFLIHYVNGDIVLYNPATHAFSPTGHSIGPWRKWATTAVLSDGRVMIAGGTIYEEYSTHGVVLDDGKITSQVLIFTP